ncbi:MAG: hypothetical protein ABIW76_20035 [Fibrobacteria bacterium]
MIEVIVASILGLLVLISIMYLYKAQNKNMLVQGSLSEMRLNGQFALREVRNYLMHAGLALPTDLRSLETAGSDLLIKVNTAKRSSAATLDPVSTSIETIYRVPMADTTWFRPAGFAAVEGEGKVVEGPIKAIRLLISQNQAQIVLTGDKARFPSSGKLYPMDKKRLHLSTGIGGDTAAGEFRILDEKPVNRAGVAVDSLPLAEGIESLRYRYFMSNRDSSIVLPANLDSLARIEITVVARTLLPDPSLLGDGYRRQTLKARVGFRRSL